MNISPQRPVINLFFAKFFLLLSLPSFSQEKLSEITIKTVAAGGMVKMLSAENGFGGGNVAASVGSDGILLVDNMYQTVTPKLMQALKKFSDSSIRIVVNTHFHSDHIQGNHILSGSTAIIAHENVVKRLKDRTGWVKASLPQITFTEKLTIHFNGEDIQLFHLPNGHTDGDVFVYFTASKVIHMGDTYFNGMFPAVYLENGGDILQMIKNIEKLLPLIPADVSVIPGHGNLATKQQLLDYVDMLKATTSLVAAGLAAGKTLEQMQEEKLLNQYDSLGEGGAQTTTQYLAMLVKLLSR